MGSSNSKLQDTFNRLTKYHKEELETVNVYGARPVFNQKVFHERRWKNDVTILELDPPLNVKTKVNRILQQWAGGKTLIVWMSENLPQHLSLPARTYPKDCWLFQALCLGHDLPPLILTLYLGTSVDKEAERSQIEEFSMKCARMLTSSLIDFCHREFILLPCTLKYDEQFTVTVFQKEVDSQVDCAREFYGGPAKLRKTAFEEVVTAVSIVARVTRVHSLLYDQNENGTEWLLVMDPDLDRCLRLVIEKIKKLARGEHLAIGLNSKIQDKATTAVLEAARRLSYSQRIVVVTRNDNIRQCVKKLAGDAENEYGLDPSWFRSVSPEETTLEADCTISIDDREIRCYGAEKDETAIQVLLVGKSGVGKSSTGNTLLGKNPFAVGVSFETVTKTCNSGIATHGSQKIEVVDSPGIFDTMKKFGSECTHPGSPDSNTTREFDVVCYVVKIGSYTEEDVQVFERIKAVLGQKVTRHMIVIFTHSDLIEEDSIETLIEKAPETLKQMLHECGNRYVLFDNTSSKKNGQFDRFLKIASDLIREKEERERKYICPGNSEIKSRWEDERHREVKEKQRRVGSFGG